MMAGSHGFNPNLDSGAGSFSSLSRPQLPGTKVVDPNLKLIITPEILELLGKATEHRTETNTGLVLITTKGLDSAEMGPLRELILELETVAAISPKGSLQENYGQTSGSANEINDGQREWTKERSKHGTRYILALDGENLVGHAKIHPDAKAFPELLEGTGFMNHEKPVPLLYLMVVDGRRSDSDKIIEGLFSEVASWAVKNSSGFMVKESGDNSNISELLKAHGFKASRSTPDYMVRGNSSI